MRFVLTAVIAGSTGRGCPSGPSCGGGGCGAAKCLLTGGWLAGMVTDLTRCAKSVGPWTALHWEVNPSYRLACSWAFKKIGILITIKWYKKNIDRLTLDDIISAPCKTESDIVAHKSLYISSNSWNNSKKKKKIHLWMNFEFFHVFNIDPDRNSHTWDQFEQ